jgi:hypothetical protein
MEGGGKTGLVWSSLGIEECGWLACKENKDRELIYIKGIKAAFWGYYHMFSWVTASVFSRPIRLEQIPSNFR